MIYKTLIMYGSLFVSLRLLGKRQLGELELSELVLAALMADIAANTLQEPDIPLMWGLVPIVTLFVCQVLLTGGVLRWVRLRELLFGKPSMLISKGVIDQRELKKCRLSPDELLQELRNHGAEDVSKVDYALLETDGRLNVVLAAPYRPVTPALMGIEAKDGGHFALVVCQGRILEDELKRAGLDLKWLEKELKRQGIAKAGEVFLLAVNEARQVYCAKMQKPTYP